MKTTSELLKLHVTVGNKLDAAAPETMKWLLKARRAVREELEARHAAAVAQPLRFTEEERQIARERALSPFKLVGVDDEGMACYEGWM
jgi:hypothetical protein